MPGGGQPIVIGGGIQLTGGAIDEFLVLTSITPPTATTSARFRRSGASLIAESVAGRLDTVIGSGATGNAGTGNNPDVVIGVDIGINHNGTGGSSQCILIGRGSPLTVTQPANIVIGRCDVFNNNLSNGSNVIIGNLVTLGAPLSPGNAVLIGASVTSSANGGDSVVIGAAAANGGGSNNVVIGRSASAVGTGTGGMIVVGQGSSVNGTVGGIVIGTATTGAAASSSIIALGSGHTNVPARAIVIGHSGQNTGLAAGDIMIGHNNLALLGYSTAVRWGGAIVHQASQAVPAWIESHKSAQGTDINAGDVTYQLPRATGNAAGASWIIETTTPGASGAVLQTLAEVARFAPGTATEPRHFQVSVSKGLWFANQVDGAGVGAGTLTNAPTAGDPAFWLPVKVNGTDMFIPCWS